MAKSLDDLGGSAEKLAEEIADNWDAIDGALMLLTMDKAIQGWIKKVDDLADAAIGELPKRTATQPDFSCEETKAAVKVSLTLKAVHLGALKLTHRILPREILKFIEKQFVDVVEKIGTKYAAKKIIGKLNLALSAVIEIAVGTATAIDYMDDLEDAIHNVLGCSIEDEEKPMRFELNEWIENMKIRNEGEPRKMKNVLSRHEGGAPSKRTKIKKKRHRRKADKPEPSMHNAGDY